MTVSMQKLLSYKHVLLLQGKMGSFFNQLSTLLQQNNLQVSKVNLNAADAFFYKHDNAYDYKDTLTNFPIWLQKLIETNDIEAVVCFGDSRPYHIKAADVCQQLDIAFFVFEEGYLRPDYITLEQHGVNGNSQLDFKDIDKLPKAQDCPARTYNHTYKIALLIIFYYTWCQIFAYRFPHYQSHRGMSLGKEFRSMFIKSPVRKMLGYFLDQALQNKLANNASGRYFLVSLQVHIDSQITHHSTYDDVTDFIKQVMVSFANNANPEHLLLFKHHPLDRGYRNYKKLINELACEYGIQGRVFYGCDMHLPTLIKNSIGMVTINSTTGLQSIYHKKPTKVMGRAIYDNPRLTDQKPLDEFWQSPSAPDYEYYGKFRKYLIEQTQLNGSFHGRSPWMQKYLPSNHNKNLLSNNSTDRH